MLLNGTENKGNEMREPEFEMRMLTLKRWMLPYSQALRDLPLGEKAYGDYISFQNYDFVDISCGFTAIEDAYGLIESKRKNPIAENFDVSIQQSIVLLGRRTDFWEYRREIPLSITMIQLQIPDAFDPSAIDSAIRKTFNGPNTKIALYYSLDFCDIVLFTRGLSLQRLHMHLWTLLCGKNELVKDSFTFFCFPYQAFISNLRSNDVAPAMVSDTLSFDIDMNIWSLDKMYQMKSALSKIGMKEHSEFQITGHYDMKAILRQVPVPALPRVVNLVDQYCRTGEGRTEFAGCNVTPVCNVPDDLSAFQDIPELEFQGKYETGLATQLRELVKRIYSDFCEIIDSEASENNEFRRQIACLTELYHSLVILHESCFANEFVLSVLPAMQELLMLCRSYQEYMRGCDDEEDRLLVREKLTSALGSLQDDFFRTFSMLVQCTMHSEREWTHAPAFNFTLFEIPPKLLMFYAVAMYYISKTLQSRGEDDGTVAFLISPGFQQDIYAQSLFPDFIKNGLVIRSNHKLVLVSLSERDFYHPSDVIESICHEASHYIGGVSRRRAERAAAIYECAGMYLTGISLTYMILDETTAEDAERLAQALGSCLNKFYMNMRNEINQMEQTSELEDEKWDYLAEIASFFSETGHNGIWAAFQDPGFKMELRQAFFHALTDMTDINLQGLASSIDDSLALNYFGELLSENQCAAIDTLAGQLVYTMNVKLYEVFTSENAAERKTMFSFFSNLTSAFSEAYADIQMIELLGIKEFSQYNQIARRYFKGKNGNTQQNRIRYNAVLGSAICGKGEGFQRKTNSDEEDSLELSYAICYAEKRLAEYLRSCRETGDAGDLSQKTLLSLYQGIRSNDIYTQIKTIYASFEQYKRDLIADAITE